MALCTQCHRRPRPKDNSRKTCRPCERLLKQNQQEEKDRKVSSPTNYSQYFRLLKWKGHLVGVRLAGPVKAHAELHPYDGRLVACTAIGPDEPRSVNVIYIKAVTDDKGLPKDKLIDLDVWQDGYSHEVIRVMKQQIQRVAPTMRLKKTVVDE